MFKKRVHEDTFFMCPITNVYYYSLMVNKNIIFIQKTIENFFEPSKYNGFHGVDFYKLGSIILVVASFRYPAISHIKTFLVNVQIRGNVSAYFVCVSRPTMGYVTYGTMTQTLRRRKKSSLLVSARWWSGSVSCIRLSV